LNNFTNFDFSEQAFLRTGPFGRGRRRQDRTDSPVGQSPDLI